MSLSPSAAATAAGESASSASYTATSDEPLMVADASNVAQAHGK
jgi:hypothetical protein